MNSTPPNILAKVNDFAMLFSSLTSVDIKIISPKIRDILDPPIAARMDHLSTNDQHPNKLDQLIAYLGELWSIEVMEEGGNDDEKKE